MTDNKYDTPNKTVVKNKGLPALSIALTLGCLVLAGIIGYRVLTAVDEEPSKIDIQLENPDVQLPSFIAPEVKTPNVDAPDVELPEVDVEPEPEA